jgi:hypothetical protein
MQSNNCFCYKNNSSYGLIKLLRVSILLGRHEAHEMCKHVRKQKLFFLNKNGSIQTIYCNYCTGIYAYKRYSNMFRLIHVAIVREYTQRSYLVKNI